MDLKTFETEGKLDEERKRRQAEWERVRKASDPVEAPPEVFDNRTLYDKLKEQHDIKKKQFEDQYALKNQIRGVDDEEAMFLSEVDDIKMKCEKLKKMEEKKEIEEYKKALEEKDKLASGLPKIHVTVQKKEKKQSELLASVVVSKRKISNSDNDSTTTTDTKQQKTAETQEQASAASVTTSKKEKEPEKDKPVTSTKPINKPIIAVLPGVGEYNTNSSSSSEYSSDDDDAGCDRIVNANEYAKETHSLFSNSANSGANSGAHEIGKV